MGLPVSGFPNMNAVSLEDATGVNYVDTTDFLKVGVLGSIMAYGEQAPRVCARAGMPGMRLPPHGLVCRKPNFSPSSDGTHMMHHARHSLARSPCRLPLSHPHTAQASS
jgi:hypothetical protein